MLMMNKELLTSFVCPMDRSPLSPADDELIAKLNRAIAAGRISNHAGQPVTQPIEGGLIRADRFFLYPILDDIPVLLADEAISLKELG
jgi:uncharacterized protein YbaR (Trm112 family)